MNEMTIRTKFRADLGVTDACVYDFTRNVAIEINRMSSEDVRELLSCIEMGCYTYAREILVKWEAAGKYVATIRPIPFKPRNELATDYHNKYNSNAAVITRHFKIKHVSFKDRTTIVVWHDDTVTKVTASEVDEFNREVGIAMCIAKRAYENLGVDGGKSKFNDIIINAIKTAEAEEQKRYEKEYKRNLAKAHNEAKEIKEKAKSKVMAFRIETHDFKPSKVRNYISRSIKYDDDGRFDCVVVRDYLEGMLYVVYEIEYLDYINDILKTKCYGNLREWLHEHAGTPDNNLVPGKNSEELSKAWCHIKDAESKDYISITFIAKRNVFDRAVVRDYGTLIEYEVFEYESAMWIKRMLNDNDYAAVRKWLGDNFEVDVEAF